MIKCSFFVDVYESDSTDWDEPKPGRHAMTYKAKAKRQANNKKALAALSSGSSDDANFGRSTASASRPSTSAIQNTASTSQAPLVLIDSDGSGVSINISPSPNVVASPVLSDASTLSDVMTNEMMHALLQTCAAPATSDYVAPAHFTKTEQREYYRKWYCHLYILTRRLRLITLINHNE